MENQNYTVRFLDTIDAGYENHLWYGGLVAELVSDDYIFSIYAVGDIRAEYISEDGESDFFVDKNNSGAFFYYFKDRISGDKALQKLIENQKKKNKPQISFGNNNWWECDVMKDGKYVINGGWVLDSYSIYDAIEEVAEQIENIKKEEVF